jgi:hypothetical protein
MHRNVCVPSKPQACCQPFRLNGKSLDLLAHGADGAGQLAGVVAGDAGGDDGSANTAGTAKSHLAADVDVRGVLVLAQKGDVQQDGQGLGIGGQENELRDTTVEGLGSLVGSLLQLARVLSTLNEVEELLLQLLVGQRPGTVGLRHLGRLNKEILVSKNSGRVPCVGSPWIERKFEVGWETKRLCEASSEQSSPKISRDPIHTCGACDRLSAVQFFRLRPCIT